MPNTLLARERNQLGSAKSRISVELNTVAAFESAKDGCDEP